MKAKRPIIVITNDNKSQVSQKKSPDDFEIVRLGGREIELGSGASGDVVLVQERTTGRQFAMKQIDKKFIFESYSLENLKSEIKIQRRLNHHNLLKLYHYFEDKQRVYMILEYAQGGSLFSYLRKRRCLSEIETRRLFQQIVMGIEYLHRQGFIHRDIKPENILLDERMNIKIADFGWSANGGQARKTLCGTTEYMAPEMIQNQPHDKSVDIWALGILLYEMLHGYSPFYAKSDREVLQNIVKNKRAQFSKTLSQEAVRLLNGLLQYNPGDRLTITQILSHQWFSKQVIDSQRSTKNSDSASTSLFRSHLQTENRQAASPQSARDDKVRSLSVMERFLSAIGCIGREKSKEPQQSARQIN